MKIINKSKTTYDYVLPDGSIHSDKTISNKVIAEVLNKCITAIKSSDKEIAKKCDIINQKVNLCNNSSTTLFHLFFKDIMTSGASYVEGSVIVNGISQPSYNPQTGFNLPKLRPKKCLTIEYQIIIDDDAINTVENYATIDYSVLDPLQGKTDFSIDTNTVVIAIKQVVLSIIKHVDKSHACEGDILTYTTKICNLGNITATNLSFYDYFNSSICFIPYSVTINDIPYPSYNPLEGFHLPDIEEGKCLIIEFKVRII